MEILFTLKKLITKLILPPLSLLLVAILALLIAKRWPRTGRVLLWSSLIAIVFFATPMVSRTLLNSLNVAPPFNVAAAQAAQAIVILGGGLRHATPEYGDTPNQYTLDRVRYGATVAMQTKLPILVTGGAAEGRTPEAPSMAKTLQQEFNVPVRWIEERARDTEDNLQFAAQILKPNNIDTIVLVTHDFHMRRSLAHCERASLTCIPAPVSIRGQLPNDPSWVYQLPDAHSLHMSALALHEIIGYWAAQVAQ